MFQLYYASERCAVKKTKKHSLFEKYQLGLYPVKSYKIILQDKLKEFQQNGISYCYINKFKQNNEEYLMQWEKLAGCDLMES